MSRQYETKREGYYEFCKEGDENCPSKAYVIYPYPKSVEACKECIDKFIEDDSLYFTDAEKEKYVYQANKKNDYGFSYESIMKLMREHQKGSKRMKILLEDRLTDANFHSACSYLCRGDYDGFEKFVAKDLPLREKFEVITSTLRKRIKNPKELEDGLNKVIEEYLASKGIKETSVEVKFCEKW
jgi:hypothetical protein